MRLFLCALLLVFARPSMGAELSVEINADGIAPRQLWLAPEGQSGDSRAWVPMPRVEGDRGLYSGRFSAQLPAGRYAFVAATLAATLGETSLLRVGKRPSGSERPLRALMPSIELTGSDLDLGRLELRSSGSLAVLVNPRDASEQAQALQDRTVWLGHLHALDRDRWSILASGNRLAVRDEAGWRAFDVMPGGRPTTYAHVAGNQFVVGGERSQLFWLDLDGASIDLSSDGLPEAPVDFVACTPEFACAVALIESPTAPDYRTARQETRLFHSSDARKGGWRLVQTVDKPASYARSSNRVAAIYGRSSWLALDLDTGQVSTRSLPFAGAGGVWPARDGLIVNGHISTDGGANWRAADRAELMAQGLSPTISVISGSFGFAASAGLGEPMQERFDGTDWRADATLPSSGFYFAPASHSLQYLIAGTSVWVSSTRGLEWQPDTALMESLFRAQPAHQSAAIPLPAASETLTDSLLAYEPALTRLNVGVDMRRFNQAGAGLVVNALIQAEVQAQANRGLQPLRDKLPEGLVQDAVRTGLERGMGISSLRRAVHAEVRGVDAKVFSRFREARNAPRALMLSPAKWLQQGAVPTLTLTEDHRQVQVTLQVSLFDRSGREQKRISHRDVVVMSGAVGAGDKATARAAWSANGGAALRQAIEASVAEAVRIGLLEEGAEPDDGEHVDFIADGRAERIRGRLLTTEGDRMLLAGRGGALWSVPFDLLLP
jgi:hypothetical protein